jgi:hypothetical protein
MSDERFFTRLAEATDAAPDTGRAPSRVRSRLYSALVVALAQVGPLRSLKDTSAAGRSLCVFEHVLRVVPNEGVRSMNPCRVCHARVLAEHVESPPIYWPHCPYVDFQRR